MDNYKRILAEVDEILNYLTAEDLLKIPEEVRKAIKENKDKEYEWKYYKTKPLSEQNINRDTLAFLSYLNMEYLLNEEQKKLMKEIYKLNDKKLEEEKRKNYKTNKIFEERQIDKQKEEVIEEKKN